MLFLELRVSSASNSSNQKLQRSYVCWHWILMQNVKENWLVISKMTWRIRQIFTKSTFKIDMKVSKLKVWCDPFIPSRKSMSLKFTGELCVMTMKNDTKFEEKLSCHFKVNMRINSSKISKIWSFMGCFWTKYMMFEIKKIQRSYVWWHWILMQNLKEKWLVLSKMTWRIWQIFTSWKIAISFWKVKWRK